MTGNTNSNLEIPKAFYFFRDKSLMVNYMTIEESKQLDNLCLCGCDQLVKSPDKWGRIRKYKKGHHNRGKDFSGEKNPYWKGGRCKNFAGYILIYKPNHPYRNNDGYVYEHRLIMEIFLKRYLKPEEVVHHIDKNKENNKIENLQLFLSNGEHLKKELKGIKRT